MQIKYTQLAIQDIDSIIGYIAKDSIVRAVAYIDKMKSKIEILMHSPLLGVECKHKKVYQECRVYIFEAYLIFYTVRPLRNYS